MPMRDVHRCDRCGQELAGGWRRAYHQGNAALPVVCDRCGRSESIRGAIGLALLCLVLLGLAGVAVWLR